MTVIPITRVFVQFDAQKYAQNWAIAAVENVNGTLTRYGTQNVDYYPNIVLSRTQSTGRRSSGVSGVYLDIPVSADGFCYFTVVSWSIEIPPAADTDGGLLNSAYYPDATDFNLHFSTNGVEGHYYNDDDGYGDRRLTFRIRQDGSGASWGNLYKSGDYYHSGLDIEVGFYLGVSFPW